MTSDPETLAALGRDVSSALAPTTQSQRARQRSALAEATAEPRRPWALWGSLGVATAVVAAFVLWRGTQTESPVTAPAVADAAGVAQPSGRPAVVPVAETAGEVEANEAPADEPLDDVVLEKGSIAIASRQAQRVTAGPYAVVVEDDAACAVTWDPETQTLDVEVQQGAVVLHGPTFVRTVVAGDTVRGTPADVTVTTRTATVDPESPQAATKTPRWRELAEQGRYSDAMAEVERRRVLDRMRHLGRGELKVLADVTRLGGAPDRSVSVLTTLRSRFPKSREAKRAAFHLGRHAEREGRHDDAVKWYRAYLAASPRGSLVQQVRGRLFTLLAKNGRVAEARAVAADYLKRDAEGPYAAAAARLTNDE